MGEGHKDLCMSSLQGPSQRKLQSWGLLVGGCLYFMSLLFSSCFVFLLTNVHSIPTDKPCFRQWFPLCPCRTQWNTCCSSFLVLSSVPLDDDLSLCKYHVCPLLMRHRKPQLEDDPSNCTLAFQYCQLLSNCAFPQRL